MAKSALPDLYGFSRSPFELGRYDAERVGRELEWRRLHELIESARKARSPVIGVLTGTYGSGKSFLLWQLASSYEPARKSHVLATKPIRLIDPEQRRDFIRDLVIRVFRRGLDLDGDLLSILRLASKSAGSAPAEISRYVDLLAALPSDEAGTAARRVLSGGRALKAEAVAGGFEEGAQVRTSDDALDLLFALQVQIRRAGVEVLAVMVDEVEYIDGLPRGQRPAVFDSLKHLWDQQVRLFSSGVEAAQLVLVLAATPAFWQGRNQLLLSESHRPEATVGLTPFFDRIPASNVIEMPAELAQGEARQLIVSRMSEVRQGKSGSSIIPFTDDYVDYVYELTQGLPRHIIEICATVMGEAARRKLVKIHRATARDILRDLLISYEPVTG